MLKEIFEQPESIENAMRGRLDADAATAKFGGLNLTPQQLRAVGRCVMTACGTSWHAALVGEYQIENLARMPVEVEYASELRYRNPPLDNNTLLFAITQSGETADTLAAPAGNETQGPSHAGHLQRRREHDRPGSRRRHLSPCRPGDRRGLDQGVHLAVHRAGDAGLVLGRLRHLSFAAGMRMIDEFQELPEKVRQTLAVQRRGADGSPKNTPTATTSFTWAASSTFPRPWKGRLKLKEISYIHAEGYPAAEMKHGPIALVDRDTPSVFLMPQGQVYDKVMSNLQEIKARGGPVIAVVGEGDTRGRPSWPTT